MDLHDFLLFDVLYS